MKIKLDSLMITEYCSQDKRKFRFIKEISEDQLVKIYVCQYMYQVLEASEGKQEIKIGHTYIIEDGRKLVGLIRLANLKEDGTLQFHYAVHPDFRRQHYGSKILTESSKYILDNFPQVDKIELCIMDKNKGSIRCAENAMFELENIKDVRVPENYFQIKFYTKKR